MGMGPGDMGEKEAAKIKGEFVKGEISSDLPGRLPRGENGFHHLSKRGSPALPLG